MIRKAQTGRWIAFFIVNRGIHICKDVLGCLQQPSDSSVLSSFIVFVMPSIRSTIAKSKRRRSKSSVNFLPRLKKPGSPQGIAMMTKIENIFVGKNENGHGSPSGAVQ